MGTHSVAKVLTVVVLLLVAFGAISAPENADAVVGAPVVVMAPQAQRYAATSASDSVPATQTAAYWRGEAAKWHAKYDKEHAKYVKLQKAYKSLQSKYNTLARKCRILQSKVWRKWKLSHGTWDKRAKNELKRQGCTTEEIRMAMWIHHHEGGPNSHGKYHGGWQLSAGMAEGNPWWDPEWSTARAVKYMRGRYGSVAAAYRFKQANGWY